MIASSYRRTSCPGGDAGLARAALAPGPRRETEFTRCRAPPREAEWGWGEQPLAPAPRERGLALGSSVALRPAARLRALRPPGTPRREMAAWMRGKDSSRCLLLLAAVLMVESSQLGGSRAKLNSIKSSLGGETPAQVANRSAGTYQGLAFGGSKKGKNLGQVGKHSKCTLQPRAVAASAPERVVCLCTPQPFKGAPRWGASHGWGGVPGSRSPWVGRWRWLVLEGWEPGGYGSPTFALVRGHAQDPVRTGGEWSFSKFTRAVLMRTGIAANVEQRFCVRRRSKRLPLFSLHCPVVRALFPILPMKKKIELRSD